jgi:hypothetical protein
VTHIATYQQDGTSIEKVEEEEEPEAAALTGAAAVAVPQLLHTQACTRVWSEFLSTPQLQVVVLS